MKHRSNNDRVGDLVEQAAERLVVSPDAVEWYSWPEVFSSTSGPRGGIGGQAMTTFQVYGFLAPGVTENGLLYCAGTWRRWNGREQRWPR